MKKEDKKKKEKKISLVVLILIILVCTFFIGLIMSLIGGLLSALNYDVREAVVYEVNNDIIKVELGKINGDPIYKDIHKPFFVYYKKGDTVLIHENNISFFDPDQIAQIGTTILTYIFTTIFLAVTLGFIISFTYFDIKNSNNKSKRAAENICFSLGLFILLYFTETNVLDFWMITGFLLIIATFIIEIFWKEK